MASNVELPQGFVLDSSPKQTPTLPEGFVLDSPAPSPSRDDLVKAAKIRTISKLKGDGSQDTVKDIAKKQSLGRTALDQGLQGASFGFADEYTDVLGSLVAKGSDLFRSDEDKLFKDRSVFDVVKEARGDSKERLQQQMEQRPVTSIAANLAGTIATGGIAGATKGGKALASNLKVGSKATKAAKGAALSAGAGGVYGAGSGLLKRLSATCRLSSISFTKRRIVSELAPCFKTSHT